MTLRKILVGVDFSEQTDFLLAQAAHLARQHDAAIVLAHVMYAGLESPVNQTSSLYADAISLYVDRIRDELWTLRARFDASIEVSELQLEGHPAPTLAVTADEIDADLVLIGSHERSGLRRFLLGSVAERTVRFCDRSVMVVKRPPADGRYRRILVPTDFSAAAEHALELSVDLAAPDATIELLHCWTTPAYLGSLEASSLGMAVLAPEIRREVQAQGMRLVAAHSDRHATLSFRQAETKPTHGIQDRLESEHFDLVVTGSHGRSGLGRWLIGSVAEHTVRHAPCSVLVVKGGGDDDE